MNWKRIALFVLLLFVATAAAAFPFGFIEGFLAAQGKTPPAWVLVGQAIAVPVAAIIVFALLAVRQSTKAFAHASVAGLLSWLLTFPINVLIFGFPAAQWFAGVFVVAIAIVIGVPIGARFR